MKNRKGIIGLHSVHNAFAHTHACIHTFQKPHSTRESPLNEMHRIMYILLYIYTATYIHSMKIALSVELAYEIDNDFIAG